MNVVRSGNQFQHCRPDGSSQYVILDETDHQVTPVKELRPVVLDYTPEGDRLDLETVQVNDGEGSYPVLPNKFEIIEEFIQVLLSDCRIPRAGDLDKNYLMPDPHRHFTIVRDIMKICVLLKRLFG